MRRSAAIAAALEVDGELRGDLAGLRSERRFQARGNLAVKVDSGGRCDAVVQHVAIELVQESVAARHRSIRPFH